ncbi:AraC family transcriptional regulator [Lentzea sp. NPDC006480]|uniref:helix-turn-helix transcriptional regulator n=1 Tax=Lentzea sp. NPDC006480 TaxID=3157176 RepID=UPI0033B7C298
MTSDFTDRVSTVWRRSGELPPELPQPSVDLLVFADGTLWLSGPETVARTGTLTQPLTGVRLKPGVCADVLGIAADEVPLAGMRLPGSGLDDGLRALSGPARAGDSVVRQVLRAIHADPGAPMSDHVVGLSPRQLRRRFQVAVGLSPKAYARVVRLHRAMDLARAGSPDWAEIALRSGFYDQPHMLAEFRRAVGMSCVRFFQATTAVT